MLRNPRERTVSAFNDYVRMGRISSGDATRVGFRSLEDGRKVRYAKRSGEVID